MKLLSVTTIADRPKREVRSALSFRQFGKIEEAKLSIAPLTVICGKNNSGKSYLAYMLWAYYNHASEIFGPRKSTIKAPTWFREIVDRCKNYPRAEPIRVESRLVKSHVNRWLGRNANKVAKRLLNYDRASLGGLKIEMHFDVYLSKTEHAPEGFNVGDVDLESWAISYEPTIQNRKKPSYAGWIARPLGDEDNIDNLLYLEVISRMLEGPGPFSSASYIPASRSGLTLALSYISDSLFASLRRAESDTVSRFTSPVISFLRALAKPPRREGEIRGPLKHGAEFLEDSIVQGHISREGGERSLTYQYEPRDSTDAFPIYIASSMVTELTSVIEAFKLNGRGDPLIIEEPEAHLHLGAQRNMARALVRAVNAGVPIVITTHSDTFLQQLNFLIMLEKNEGRQSLARKLGYSDDEFLRADDVIAYELCADGGRTSVKSLEVGEYGITASSLSDVIINMSQEIIEVSE